MATASAIYTAPPAYFPTDHRPFPLYPHPAIHGFNVPPGVYISPPDQHEAHLGRKLAPTPRRLTSRTLYLPSHSDKVAHLPVYDFTKEYKDAVRNEPVGSSRFKTNLGLMRKPVGDGSGASEVSYLVDFEPLEARTTSALLPPSPPASPVARSARRKSSAASSLGGTTAPTRATVRRRMLYGGAEVGLTMPARGPCDGGDVACTLTPASTGAPVSLLTSYPLRPTVSKFGSSRNPWFTFTLPGSLLDGERTLQWQVHPLEHGLLRYTLVELPARGAAAGDGDRWWEDDSNKKERGYGYSSGEGEEKKTSRRRKRSSEGGEDNKPPFSASDSKNEHLVRAIYHNVGLGFCLSQPFSEGALLLQNDLDPEFEAVIVASLLGLLWRARGEESKSRKNSKSEGTVLPRKKSVSVVTVDEKEWASTHSSPHSSPERKGLFRKILRRMS